MNHELKSLKSVSCTKIDTKSKDWRQTHSHQRYPLFSLEKGWGVVHAVNALLIRTFSSLSMYAIWYAAYENELIHVILIKYE